MENIVAFVTPWNKRPMAPGCMAGGPEKANSKRRNAKPNAKIKTEKKRVGKLPPGKPFEILSAMIRRIDEAA